MPLLQVNHHDPILNPFFKERCLCDCPVQCNGGRGGMNNEERGVKMGLEVSHSRDHWAQLCLEDFGHSYLWSHRHQVTAYDTHIRSSETWLSLKPCTGTEAGIWGGRSFHPLQVSFTGTWRPSSDQSELYALHSTGKSVEVFNIFTRHGGLLTMTWALEGASPHGALVSKFSSPARTAEKMNLLPEEHEFKKKNSELQQIVSSWMNDSCIRAGCPCFPDLAVSETVDCARTTKTQVKNKRDENPTGSRALVFPSYFLSFFVSVSTQEMISY